jgi:hypothetical protein
MLLRQLHGCVSAIGRYYRHREQSWSECQLWIGTDKTRLCLSIDFHQDDYAKCPYALG